MVLFFFIILVCYIPQIDSFLPKTDFGEGIPDINLFRLSSFFLFLLFVIHSVIKKDLKIVNKWIAILALFYLVVIASISWSTYSYNTHTLQIMFNSAFIPFLIALIAVNLFDNPEASQVYIKNFVIAAFIMSLISITQAAVGILSGSSDFRASGTFGNPNLLAVILVLSIPCILYSIEKGLFSAVFGKTVSVSVITGILFTVSRKGIITMVICYLIYNLLKKNYKNAIIIFMGFVALGAVVSTYSVVSQRFEKEEFMYHMDEKWEMVLAGVKMFKSSPIIGLGYQGYYENFRHFFSDAFKDKYSAHNIFITALANYGLIGFIPFLLIFTYPLLLSIKILKKVNANIDSTNNYLIDMAIICFTSLVPFMISGWFAGGLFYRPEPIAFLYANISLLLANSHSFQSIKE